MTAFHVEITFVDFFGAACSYFWHFFTLPQLIFMLEFYRKRIRRENIFTKIQWGRKASNLMIFKLNARLLHRRFWNDFVCELTYADEHKEIFSIWDTHIALYTHSILNTNKKVKGRNLCKLNFTSNVNFIPESW